MNAICRHSRESGNPVLLAVARIRTDSAADAALLDFRFRGNDKGK